MTIPQILNSATKATNLVKKWLDFPNTDDIKRTMAYKARVTHANMIPQEEYARLLDFANENYPQHSGDP